MTLIRAFLIAVVLAPVSTSAQTLAPHRLEDEIRSQVRSLITATNYDAMATMDMYVRSPRISSINDGRIVQGWDDLYRQTRESAATQGSFFVRLGEIDVTPMGPDHALAVAPITLDYQTAAGGVQLPGSMTLAFVRMADGWKILHEHYSTGLDEATLSRIAGQANAGDAELGSLLRLLIAGFSGDVCGLTNELINLIGPTSPR